MRPGFEGGQMPLYRRLPKRGFNNIFRREYVVVNLEKLATFDAGAKIDPVVLRDNGIIKNLNEDIKILGTGELTNAIHVYAHKFSKSAIMASSKTLTKTLRFLERENSQTRFMCTPTSSAKAQLKRFTKRAVALRLSPRFYSCYSDTRK